MELLVIIVFVLGYLAITLEHTLKVDKLVPALVMMAISWAIIALNIDTFNNWFSPAIHGLVEGFSDLTLDAKTHLMEETLLHHLGKTAEILVFLLGAMTIVEIIDYFNGFSVIKDLINYKKKKTILWIFGGLAFLLSAIIDNLTATIVLISILQKVVSDKNMRLWYAGLIIISANAGGAWSPIGDVTTTMLWIGDKVTTIELIYYLLIPSIVCMVVPTSIATLLPQFKGEIELNKSDENDCDKYSSRMLILGLSAIIFVPIFKVVTHLPPYIGMMLSLGVVSIFAEIFSNSQYSLSKITSSESVSHSSPVHKALTKIEMPSILFFLGILMGVGSAIIDNVPLVAASLGMFTEPVDHPLWHFIAYSAGTGGSMLIIGSAAGVVAMGMEKINFFWYLKKISWLALIGFISGAAVFVLIRDFI